MRQNNCLLDTCPDAIYLLDQEWRYVVKSSRQETPYTLKEKQRNPYANTIVARTSLYPRFCFVITGRYQTNFEPPRREQAKDNKEYQR